MQKLSTLRVLEDESGEILKSGLTGESLYYAADWEELRDIASVIAKENGEPEPDDVRVAYYALDILNIPNHHTETDQDEHGNWVVYWR